MSDENESRCGRCGGDPAYGFAEINGVRYCHGALQGVSCYERQTADLVPPSIRDLGDPEPDLADTHPDLDAALDALATALGFDGEITSAALVHLACDALAVVGLAAAARSDERWAELRRLAEAAAVRADQFVAILNLLDALIAVDRS